MSEVNVAMDITGVLNAVGAWNKGAAAIQRKASLVKATRAIQRIMNRYWTPIIDEQAVSMGLIHMYKWNETGRPGSRLFELVFSNSGDKGVAKVLYYADTSYVPLENQYESSMAALKPTQSRHIIVDKARRFEERMSETGFPGQKDPLVEVEPGESGTPQLVSYVPRGKNQPVFFRKYENDYAAEPVQGDYYYNNPTWGGRIYDTLNVSYGTYGKMAMASHGAAELVFNQYIDGAMGQPTADVWAKETARQMSLSSYAFTPSMAKKNQIAPFVYMDRGHVFTGLSNGRLSVIPGTPTRSVQTAVYRRWDSIA